MKVLISAVLSLLVFSSAFGVQKTSGARAISVTCMTFNVQASNLVDFLHSWKSRKDLAFDLVSANNPDVLGLQEPLYEQVFDFKKTFPQYACYWAGGDDGRNDGQGCPIFYRSDKFDLVDSGTFWYSDDIYKPGAKGWGNLIPRFCSWVQLSPKGQKNNFYVYNTHLDSLSQGSRNKSVRLLKKEVSSRRGHSPFIIMGDFNMLRTNKAMTFLLDGNGLELVDAWKSLYPDAPDSITYEPKGRQIDHILMGINTRAINIKVDNRKPNGRYASDHFPVIADISFSWPEVTLGKR